MVLYQLSIGHYVSRALHVAAHLGLADQLADGPRSADDLAAATGTHAPSLNRVLRLLASATGIFAEQEDGRFALEPIGELLREDVPGSMRAMVMLFAGTGIQDSWKDLEYCVRTGEPAFRRTDPDADPFTQMAQDPEAAAIFDKAMATFAPQTAAAVAAAYDFSGLGTIADVGGGNGALLIGILTAQPAPARHGLRSAARGRAGAQQIADAAGTRRPLRAVGGNFFEAVPRGRRRLPAEARHPRLERRARDARSWRNCRARHARDAASCSSSRASIRRASTVAREPRRRRQRRQHAGRHRRAAALGGGVRVALRGVGLPPHPGRADDGARVRDRGRAGVGYASRSMTGASGATRKRARSRTGLSGSRTDSTVRKVTRSSLASASRTP